METTPPLKPLEMHLAFKEVRFGGFSTTDYADSLKTPPAGDDYEFRFELSMNFSAELKSAEFSLKTTIHHLNVEGKPELGMIKSSITILIGNFEDVIKTTDGSLKVPNELVLTGYSVVISTTRGMFAICAATSPISNAILPLINPQTLLSNSQPQQSNS